MTNSRQRRRGRPAVADPISSSLTIRIPETLRVRLGAQAEAEGVTIGAVVREALERHLERGSRVA
jgi:predicted DNA-binding protein